MTEHDTISQAQSAGNEAAKAEERHQKSRDPFPLLEGSFFHFTLGGLQAMEKAADDVWPGWQDRGLTAFGVMERLLLDGHPAAVRAAIDAGLKREGENGKPVPCSDIDLEEIEWPVSDIVMPALNAFAYGYFRQSYDEIIAEVTAAAEARAEKTRKEQVAG